MLRLCAVAAIVALASPPFANGQTSNLINTVNVATGVITTPGAATTCDGDLFPQKTSVNFAAQFSIEYYKTYKVVTNNQAKKTYVLYQRGCAKPTGVSADAFVEVPLTAVSVASSTFLKFIEILGERSSVVGVNGQYSASSCLNQRFQKKLTVDASNVVYNASASTPGYFLSSDKSSVTGTDYAKMNQVQAFFGSPFDTDSTNGQNIIVISSDYEPTWQAVAEWEKYVAAFYNKEATVNSLNQDSRSRWICASNRALVSTPKKKALWITFVPSTFYGKTYGFEFAGTAKGKNKYVDLLTAAGLDVLDGATFTGDAKSFSEVAAWAKDVDYLFIGDQSCTFKGITGVAECDKYWGDFLSQLGAIKAVANKQAYDIGRIQDPSGGTDFLGSAAVEPDVVLADVVSITTPGTGHSLVYLRNMLNEGVGNVKACADYPSAAGCIPTAASLAVKCDAQGGLGAPSPSMVSVGGTIACVASAAPRTLAAGAWIAGLVPVFLAIFAQARA